MKRSLAREAAKPAMAKNPKNAASSATTRNTRVQRNMRGTLSLIWLSILTWFDQVAPVLHVHRCEGGYRSSVATLAELLCPPMMRTVGSDIGLLGDSLYDARPYEAGLGVKYEILSRPDQTGKRSQRIARDEKVSAEETVRHIRRQTRQQYGAGEKIRIVLGALHPR